MISRLTFFFIALTAGAKLHSAVFIQNYQDAASATQATFLSSTGASLTSGGISIGFFTSNTAPSLAQVQALAPSTAFSTLVSTYGFVDLRSLSGSTSQTYAGFTGPFDWTYGGVQVGNGGFDIAGQISASVTATATSTASSTNLPVGTRLYLLAFNSGNFLSSFSTATEWAFTGDNAAGGTVPSDLASRNVRVGGMDGAEVWVGTEDGNNVRLAAIPEPSKVLLTLVSLAMTAYRRRR